MLRFKAFIISLFLVFPCFSQETINAKLSISKDYPTLDENIKLYYDLDDNIIMCKINSEKIVVQKFNKASQTITEKSSLPRKDLIWIEGIRKNDLLYCFFWKWGKNKMIRAAKEVYLDIIDLQSGDFIEQQKLLFETKLNSSTMGWDVQNHTQKAFQTSISDNSNYIAFYYYSRYTGPSKEDQFICNVFSIENLKISSEVILKHTLNEPLTYIESKTGPNGEVLYLARAQKSKHKFLGIISEDGSEIQNIPLSNYLNDIDSLRFFKNESNGNLLIGGTYFWDEDESKPANFAMEIDYEGALVKKINYFPDNYRGLEILNISLEKGNSFCLTTANFETNEISHEFIGLNVNALKSFKNSPHTLSYLGPDYFYPYFRIIESEHFKDVFYFSKNPSTGFKNLYLNRYSKSENTFKDYLILENEKIESIQLKQIILLGIIPSDENTFYLEVSLGEKKDAMITIHLK